MSRQFSDHDKQAYEQVIRELMRGQPDIEGMAVVTINGLLIAAILPINVTPDRFEHIAPDLAQCASLAADLMSYAVRGGLDSPVYIKSAAGFVLIFSLSRETLLVMICKRVKPGMIFAGSDPTISPFVPTPDPIFPSRPLTRLTAGARLDNDDPSD